MQQKKKVNIKLPRFLSFFLFTEEVEENKGQGTIQLMRKENQVQTDRKHGFSWKGEGEQPARNKKARKAGIRGDLRPTAPSKTSYQYRKTQKTSSPTTLHSPDPPSPLPASHPTPPTCAQDRSNLERWSLRRKQEQDVPVCFYSFLFLVCAMSVPAGFLVSDSYKMWLHHSHFFFSLPSFLSLQRIITLGSSSVRVAT